MGYPAPLLLSCPVCGENHPAKTAGGWVYLVCPLVAQGTMVEMEHPLMTALIRRQTAAWN